MQYSFLDEWLGLLLFLHPALASIPISYFVVMLSRCFMHPPTDALCVDDLTPVLLACGPALCRLSCAFPILGHHIISILLYVIATLADAVAVSGNSRCYDELTRRISALTPDAASRNNEGMLYDLSTISNMSNNGCFVRQNIT